MTIKQRWLNFLLHFSGLISRYKSKLINASGPATIGLGLAILFLEIANFVISLPAYFFISPQDFGTKSEEVAAYRLRRRISLSVIGAVILAWLLKLGIGALVTIGLFSGGSRVHADTVSWDFNNPVAYLYDSSKVQIVDGMAVFKASPVASPVAITQPITDAVSLPPTTETVAPSASTEATIDTSIDTSVDSGATDTATEDAASSGVDANTGAPPVETAPLAPVADSQDSPTSTSTETPTVSAPAPAPEPAAPAPSAPEAPSAPSGGGLLPYLKSWFTEPAYAQTNSTSGAACEATIQPLVPLAPLNLQDWTGFTDVVNASSGHVEYQLSPDSGATWQYWNGNSWAAAGSSDYNDSIIINEHISEFSTTTKTILFRAKMVSDCNTDVQLLGISVTYDHVPPVPVEPSTTTYTLKAAPGITFTDEYGASITATTKSAYITLGTQRIAYVELNGDLDLSTSVILGDGIVTLVNIDLLSRQNVDKFELMVPKVLGQTELLICPTLSTLAAILPLCPGAVTLSATIPNAGAYALVKLDAPDYWYIDVTTTGIIALGAAEASVQALVPQVPEVPETTCGTIFSGDSVTGDLPALSQTSDYAFTSEMTLSSSGESGVQFRTQDSANFWQLLFRNGTARFSGQVDEQTTLANNSNIAAFTPDLNVTYMVKVQVHGSLLRAKWWVKGQAEPAAWLLYADDNRIVSGGIAQPANLSAASIINNFIVTTCLEDDTVSLQETNTQNLLNNNHAPEIVSVIGEQQADNGFVNITYTVKDLESNFVSLPIYEYSLTGSFSGEEKTMMQASTDIDHQGTSTLSASSDGVSHIFVWNAASDLGDLADPSVYVRLKPTDSLEAGSAVTSQPFAVDVKKPEISNIVAAQNTGSDLVTINYDIVNTPTSNVSVVAQLSFDGGNTWQETNIAGDNSALTAIGTTRQISINWDAGENFADKDETDIRVRIRATDLFNNTSEWVVSSNFAVDTKDPFGLADFKGQASDTNSILWSWSPVAAESNFDYYVISYRVADESELSYKQVTKANVYTGAIVNPNLGIMGTNSLLISGLKADTTYYASISAVDRFGHQPTGLTAEFKTKASTSVIPDSTSEPASAGSPESSESESGSPIGVGNDTSINDVLPSNADNVPVAPAGGFQVMINGGDADTNKNLVTLSLNAGRDVETMAISNFADMHDAILEPYSSSKEWNLCAQDGEVVSNCSTGAHQVYVRYYTKWGISSSAVSDRINLTAAAESNGSSSVGSSGGSSGLAGSGESGSGVNTANNGRTNRSGDQTSVSSNSQQSTSGAGGSSGSAGTASQNNANQTIVPPLTVPIINNLARAKESPILLVPKVTAIKQAATANTIELVGSSIPNTEVVLFVHSDQAVMYSAKADHTGAWRFVHSQEDVHLAPGEHSIFAVTYDSGSKIKSKPSLVKTFEVKKSKLAEIRSYFHLSTTLLTLLVGLLAAIYLFRHRLSGPKSA